MIGLIKLKIKFAIFYNWLHFLINNLTNYYGCWLLSFWINLVSLLYKCIPLRFMSISFLKI